MRRAEIAACIYPIHSSIYGKPGFKPRGMDRLTCSREEQKAMIRIAMSIFADCTNVGVPFQNSILAVYLSGLQHGQEIARDRT